MRRTFAAILSSFVLSIAFASVAHAQTDAAPVQTQTPARPTKTPAEVEFNAGSSAYLEGRYAEAEQHFRRALELNPEIKKAPLSLARAIRMQYESGVETPENAAIGERAEQAFRDILNNDPQDDGAYKGLLLLYGEMKRDDRVVETLTERANNSNVFEEKRAEAFVILASRQWQCSYDITERRENRTRDTKSGRVSYRMPADPADFARARQCADEGLQFIEQAVSLNPKGPSAWTFKANLLREASKLAEMRGDTEQKEELEKQYAEAFDAQKRTGAEENRRLQEQRKTTTEDAPSAPLLPAPPTSFPIEEF